MIIRPFILFWAIRLAAADNANFEVSLLRLIQDGGYNVEVHKIHTEDDYILTVFRLPSKRRNPKIIFLMHGLESSAADFIIGGKNASLAYLLADNGYDIWLGNARGTLFSRGHKTLSAESPEFWEFSFHEIAIYDLPAIIDYALKKSAATSLYYIGHSQGTTTFFILLSMRPEYNTKISTAFLMAPVAFMHFPWSLVQQLVPISDGLWAYVFATRQYDLFVPNQFTRGMVASFCNKRVAGLTVCKAIYSLAAGHTNSQYKEDLFPKLSQFFPAAAGYRQILHYAHIIKNNGNFIRFDHQKERNLELYGQAEPPQYNLSNIRSNMHFLYGSSDTLANPKDVEFLIRKLKSHITGITKIDDFNHLDFVCGKDAAKKVNNVILQSIKSNKN